MFDTYLIEVADRPAGILQRSGEAFAFHAVEPPFASLNGTTFPDPLAAERAARRLLKTRGQERAWSRRAAG